MRTVLDTNLLLPSLRRGGRLRWLFDALLDGAFTLIVSVPILMEYEEVVSERTTPEVARNLLQALAALPNVVEVAPTYRWRLIAADPDDDKFVDAYVASRAEALVTHDAHFFVLSEVPFPPVNVLSAEDFRKALRLPG